MKNKKTISRLFATASLALASIAPGFAQTNLGAECGCPTPVSSRPTVDVATLATSGGALDGELTAAVTIFTCDKTWILSKKIYVPNGKTLIIEPGTVIKGNTGTAANATTVSVEVGGKIIAAGTDDCGIVFTAAADNLDGSFPIASNGQWGGVTIAGKATNNLTLAANGPFQAGVGDGRLCVADGIGTFEGFASTNSKDQFGVTPSAFDDNDCSGILHYVSIRYAGAILQVGGELNGLSLGSVGRGTIIDQIEIVSSADDGMEFWGGTVNIKHYTSLFGNDDMFDWDDGYRGKAQFVFGMKTTTGANVDSDNGFECDADDQKSNLGPRSHPVIFNSTMIGNSKVTLTSDNSALAGINAKELTEGEIYNSVIAHFKTGFNLVKTLGTRTGSSEAYHNWAVTGGNGSQSLKVKCNTFVGNTDGITVDKLASNVIASDNTQFLTTDLNVVTASVPGFDFGFDVNNSTNAILHQADVIPNPALSTSGCPTPPVDGFFEPAAYRGAFDPSNISDLWLSEFSYAQLLSAVNGLQPCPTDINGDGITNNSDFLQLLGQFNQNCQ